jgi:hypothetical protein
MKNSSDHTVCKEHDRFLLFLFIRFWITALIIGLGFGLLLQDQDKNWIVSILAGASAGVCISFLICRWTWLIYMRITRGAPFQVGDLVEIIEGPLEGEFGQVRKLCEGHPAVYVELKRDTKMGELHYFDWRQVRRIETRFVEGGTAQTKECLR